MIPDIFARRDLNFVLWRVAVSTPPPELIIGQLQLGAPVSFIGEQRFVLQPSVEFPDLWLISADACNLAEDQVYHYWFEVTDSHPSRSGQRIRVTDPLAYTVDWRLLAPQPNDPLYTEDDRYPSAVILYQQGKLIPCDAGGETGALQQPPPLSSLPPNNRTVLYELPTTWTRIGSAGEREIGLGTFCDVTSLIISSVSGENFSDLEVTQTGRSYLTELGITALELLPPADSFYQRQWGYGTTNFFAPDFELGYAADYSWPTPNRDLRALIDACHSRGLRFFVDVVMAFSRTNAYLAAATNDFFILDPENHPSDPDAHNSRGKDSHNIRNGFGSTLFRYAALVNGYDPISGQQRLLSPARQLMKAALLRWMTDFHMDGIRMDSVENVYHWDFIQEYKDLARDVWQQRFTTQGANAEEADERFLVVGEELQEPLTLLDQQRLDGLWHESFKKYIRGALLGEVVDTDFATTVRKAIDCRNFGYRDGAQAIIYLTSHDVEGYRNERLYNFFLNNGVAEADIEKRIKLAFACLLTAVGVPMILAGDEFADQHDLFDQEGNVKQEGGKQVDPVNFSRLSQDGWRQQLKNYVARLIKFRTLSNALAVNDTEFIHTDFNDGKRVIVWRRGQVGSDDVVVVLANFSDFGTADPGNPASEYRVPNWPFTPAGKRWREISQERDVPPQWIGREPIFPWEAKIYTLL